MSTVVQVAIATYLVATVAAALWYHMSNRAWVRELVRRNMLSEYSETGALRRAERSISANLELIRDSPRLAAKGLQLQFSPDADRQTERSRRAMNHRLLACMLTLFVGWMLPLGVWVGEQWVTAVISRGEGGTPATIAFVAAGGAIGSYAMGRIVAGIYGVGTGTRSASRVIVHAVGLLVLIVVMVVQTVLMHS